MKHKRFIAAAMALVVATTALAGCGSNKEDDAVSANGAIKKDQIESGLYIMTKNGDFYAPNTDGQNFDSEVTSGDARRIIYSNEDSKYIPTMYVDDKIVYFTSGAIPTNFGVEKFRDAGYTFGLYGIGKNSGGEYTFSSSSFIPGSTLESSFNGYLDDSDVATLLTVDGKEIAVDDLSVAGTFKCEKKDQKVKIAFMKGTYYNEVESYADEHVWYSAETASVLSYETTKNGFIVLNLPDGLKDGDYISVMGTGLMKISTKNRTQEDKDAGKN